MKQRWDILAELVNSHHYKIVAEVGTNRGINAANWIERCPELEKAYLIDVPTNDVFCEGEFTDRQVLHKITYLAVGSESASKIVPNELDLVFIDADHSYDAVKNDIELWLPKIRKGGIICGHDYVDYIEYGVKQAVDEMFINMHLEDDVLEEGQLKLWWTYVN